MIPFAVVGSERNVIIDGKQVRGRKNRWGVINIEDENHCEFVYLRNFLTRFVQILLSLSSRTIIVYLNESNKLQDTPTGPHRDDRTDPLRGVPFEAAARAQGEREGAATARDAVRLKDRATLLRVLLFLPRFSYSRYFVNDLLLCARSRTMIPLSPCSTRSPFVWNFLLPFYAP